MKTNVKFLTVILFVTFYSANLAFSQEAKKDCKQHQSTCIHKDLSESQKTSINAIKLASDKKIAVYKADLKIKNAELDKLLIAENPSKKEIDAKIDDLTKLKGDIKKERIDCRLKIREVLTPEQRVNFDLKGKGKKNHKDSQCEHHKEQFHGKHQPCSKSGK
jgi:Spy/CpxP family protein refolding chaperone